MPRKKDDGYLTASEIAVLMLHADWVILSAGGVEGAEALSGLGARPLYAGDVVWHRTDGGGNGG
jgi:hypothetical protein